MKIYNTLTKTKQEFKPLKDGKVLMYHCGPTVYWTQHIGNMRAMVWADLIARTFRYLNYDVTLVRNYTDVGHLTSDEDEGEDKMEKAAKRENLDPLQIAEKYIRVFEKDIRALNISDANYKPRATQYIKEIIEMVQILLDKGFAYTTDLAIYFDVSKAKDYNRLTGQKLEEKIKDAGKAEVSDINKKHPADFALWFFRTGKHANALQCWPSPFMSKLVEHGDGFPGWHIECSVMAKKILGDTIDIHMGGVEHIPVHHTNEIAQSESANGVEFVHYWIHNEHLTVGGGKMSKSEGTAYSVKEIITKGFNPLALRYFFLQAHLRSKQNFTWEAMQAAQNGLDNLYNQIKLLGDKKSKVDKEIKNKFVEKLNDDFNMPQAMAVVQEMLKSNLSNEDKLATILDFGQVLGLNLDKIKIEKINVPQAVKKLVAARKQARQNKDWALSDNLREEINNLGFVIEDMGEESVVKEK